MVRTSLNGGVRTNGPIFVSVGGFEDLSVNPRLKGVEAALRAHLSTVLPSARRVLLERELTGLLLEEMRMQQAGLLAAGTSLPRIQTAFWLVDGRFQSVDSVGEEIDLTVRLTRIGGGVERKTVRARQGSALNQAVANAVEGLAAKEPATAPQVTRKGEIRAQLAAGMERAELEDRDLRPMYWFSRLRTASWNDGPDKVARRAENLKAAISMFESVLLLDPEHVEARLYLARCLVEPPIHRPAEALELYRELLGNRSETTALMAAESIGYTFLLYDDARRAGEWFKQCQANPVYGKSRAFSIALDTVSEGLNEETAEADSPARKAKEERLVEAIRACREQAMAGRHFYDGNAYSTFIQGRAGGLEEGRQHLVEFFPKLAAEVPELRPFMLVEITSFLRSTNNQVHVELERYLTELRKNPTEVLMAKEFYRRLVGSLSNVGDPAYRPLSVLVTDTLDDARRAGIQIKLGPAKIVRMAYSLLEVGRVEEALAKFQSIPDQVVAMDGSGPWGRYPLAYVIPENRVRACLRQLGRPFTEKPEFMDLPEAVLIRQHPFVFVPDGSRLWVACCDQVVDQPVGGGLAVTNRLPISSDTPPKVMVQSATTLWIGTEGSGLLEYDKQTGRTRQRTTADGLLFDDIRALHLDGTQLWIGSAGDRAGGLSRLDLTTGHINSFVPALVRINPQEISEVERTAAPRRPVTALMTDGRDGLWVGVEDFGVQRLNLKEGSWTTPLPSKEQFSHIACFATHRDWLLVGEAPQVIGESETNLLTMRPWDGGTPVLYGPSAGLPYPSVTTVAVDGDQMWIGGPGYVAVMDLKSRRILKRNLMNSTRATQLSIQGDSVWVKLNNEIARFSRNVAR
jgi:tetratricopeptide (TPR) repeat protein